MLFADFAIYVLDMVGVVACAVAGTTLALYKRFDIFGCILVSLGLWGILFVLVRFSQNGVIIPEFGIILPIVILAGFAGFKFYKNA